MKINTLFTLTANSYRYPLEKLADKQESWDLMQ
jgi:hypothetical protein